MQHHIEQWHYCKFFLFKDISVDFCLSARHITAEWLPQWRAEVQHADTGSLVLCMLLWRTEIFCCHFRCKCCLTTSVLYSHHCSQCAHSKLLFCLYHHSCLVSITLCLTPFLSLGQDVHRWGGEILYKAWLDAAHPTNCARDCHCAMKWLKKINHRAIKGLRTKFSNKEIINERRSY